MGNSSTSRSYVPSPRTDKTQNFIKYLSQRRITLYSWWTFRTCRSYSICLLCHFWNHTQFIIQQEFMLPLFVWWVNQRKMLCQCVILSGVCTNMLVHVSVPTFSRQGTSSCNFQSGRVAFYSSSTTTLPKLLSRIHLPWLNSAMLKD